MTADAIIQTTPRQGIHWEFEKLDRCPVCHGAEFSVVFVGEIRSVPLQFTKCASCGLIVQNPRPTCRALENYFSSRTFIEDSSAADYDLEQPLGYHNYSEWDASYKATASLRLKRIMAYRPPPAKLLEIGTATGSFLDVARRFGYAVRGIDVSTLFAEMARRKYGLDIDSHFIEDAPLPPATYDVVCNFGGISCWREPVRALVNIRRSLTPNGIFVLNFSDIDALVGRLLGRWYPEFNHASLSVFSTATIQRTLQTAGFDPVFFETERQYASIGRIVTYFRSRTGRWLANRLRIDNVTIPVVAIGTVFGVCLPSARASVAY